MKEHVTVLGALYIAFNIQGVIVGLVLLMVIGGGGLLSKEVEAIAITSGIAISIAFLLFLLSIPGIVGGVALIKRCPWARILVLILGCLNLFCIPFGTILGAYTIWVLTKKETIQLFSSEGTSRAANVS
jgi:hypothetical protein